MYLTHIPNRKPIELVSAYPEFSWYYPECEMQTKDWFVKKASPDWVYIDCGANVGVYSILFSLLSPQGSVHAVEPTKTIEMLQANLRHNNCRNVTTHKLAMGQYSGRRTDKIFRLWGNEAEEGEYEFDTIDSLVGRLNLERLDCLKIDVDSFDFEVLMGAEKTLINFDPWLVVELNHALAVRGYSNLAAMEWLVDHGYRECLLLDHDNFVVRRSAASDNFRTGKSLLVNFPLSK